METDGYRVYVLLVQIDEDFTDTLYYSNRQLAEKAYEKKVKEGQSSFYMSIGSIYIHSK